MSTKSNADHTVSPTRFRCDCCHSISYAMPSPASAPDHQLLCCPVCGARHAASAVSRRRSPVNVQLLSLLLSVLAVLAVWLLPRRTTRLSVHFGGLNTQLTDTQEVYWLQVGDTLDFAFDQKVSGVLGEAQTPELFFSAPFILCLEDNDTLIAQKPGEVVLYAQADRCVYQKTIHVIPPEELIHAEAVSWDLEDALSREADVLWMLEGDRVPLTLTATPAGQFGPPLSPPTLSSSAPDVLQVENDGVTLNAVGTGTAELTLRCDDLTQTATIHVVSNADLRHPSSLSWDADRQFNHDSGIYWIVEGEQRSLSAQAELEGSFGTPPALSPVFSSSDPSVLSVSSDGHVSALHAGTATLSVSAGDLPPLSVAVCIYPLTEAVCELTLSEPSWNVQTTAAWEVTLTLNLVGELPPSSALVVQAYCGGQQQSIYYLEKWSDWKNHSCHCTIRLQAPTSLQDTADPSLTLYAIEYTNHTVNLESGIYAICSVPILR